LNALCVAMLHRISQRRRFRALDYDIGGAQSDRQHSQHCPEPPSFE